jgi:hypothetical protein
MHPKLRLFQSHQQQDDKNIRGPRKQEQQAMNDRGPSIGATTRNNNNSWDEEFEIKRFVFLWFQVRTLWLFL